MKAYLWMHFLFKHSIFVSADTTQQRLPDFEIPEQWLPPVHTPLVPEDCSALDVSVLDAERLK
jgi:hypothetical protein